MSGPQQERVDKPKPGIPDLGKVLSPSVDCFGALDIGAIRHCKFIVFRPDWPANPQLILDEPSQWLELEFVQRIRNRLLVHSQECDVFICK